MILRGILEFSILVNMLILEFSLHIKISGSTRMQIEVLLCMYVYMCAYEHT